MKDLHNWVERADQLAVSIAIILELVCLVMKEFEDIIGRSAVLELLCKRLFGEVYPSLIEMVSQGSIENNLRVGRLEGRGEQCRRHGADICEERPGYRFIREQRPSYKVF
jgi:hypothetical protein